MRLTKIGFEVNSEFVVLISEVNKLSFAGFEDACCRVRVRAAKLASLVGR